MEATLRRRNLVLPSSGYELDREEMCYVKGGKIGTEMIARGVAFIVGAAKLLKEYGCYKIAQPHTEIFGLTFDIPFTAYVSS